MKLINEFGTSSPYSDDVVDGTPVTTTAPCDGRTGCLNQKLQNVGAGGNLQHLSICFSKSFQSIFCKIYENKLRGIMKSINND